MEAEGVGLLVKGNGVLFAVGHAPDDNARQSVFALQADHVIAVANGLENKTAGPMRFEIGPIRGIRGVDRCADNAKVFRATEVCCDDKLVAVVLDVVLVPGLACGDQPWGLFRRVGIDQADLARLVIMGVDENVLGRLSLF